MKPATAVACFLLGLLVGIGMSGRAADWVVGTVGSRHLDGGDYCERNPGLGLESGEDLRTLVGAYRNSLREVDGSCKTWSAYLGKSWLPLKFADLRAGVAGMAIVGYESPITIGAAAVLSYEGERNGFNIVWFPDSGGNLTKGVIALQIKRRF